MTPRALKSALERGEWVRLPRDPKLFIPDDFSDFQRKRHQSAIKLLLMYLDKGYQGIDLIDYGGVNNRQSVNVRMQLAVDFLIMRGYFQETPGKIKAAG